MKYCPTCQTEYDEEILRFCTKDGTPLIDESQPHFTDLPSVSAEKDDDDFGEETIIRKEKPLNPPPMDIVEDTAIEAKKDTESRFVIPTQESQIRAKTTAYVPVPPPKSNTALVVVTTILLTLVILGGIAALFWAFNGNNNGANVNVNTNPPENLNVSTNSIVNIPPTNFDYNINSNYNFNSNINTNFNTNIKTPTPTKSPTPSPSPSASPDANTNVNTNTRTPTPTVSRTPTPTVTPRTAPSGEPTLRPVNVGVLNGRAVNLPKPAYPSSAKQVGANGQVSVQVMIDESGNVTSAKATSGHPLLRQSAEAAARQTRFNPITVGNQSVKASGILLYNFVNQ